MGNKTYSSIVMSRGSKYFIETVDVLRNYLEWYFKPGENPEVVAAEFLVEQCPKMSYRKVLQMFNTWADLIDRGIVLTEEEFVLDYVEINEILKDDYLHGLET